MTRIRAPQCTHSRHRNGKRPAQPTGQVPGQRPSAGVEHVGQDPQRVRRVPTVRHPGERLGHSPQSCGHLTHAAAGEASSSSRVAWDLSVPDMTPHPVSMRGPTTPRASMTHADADSTGAMCVCPHPLRGSPAVETRHANGVSLSAPHLGQTCRSRPFRACNRWRAAGRAGRPRRDRSPPRGAPVRRRRPQCHGHAGSPRPRCQPDWLWRSGSCRPRAPP